MNDPSKFTVEDIFGKSPAEREAWEADRYEQEIVDYLIARYKLWGIKREMLRKAARTDGPGGLMLAAFYEWVPMFPIYLVAAKFTSKQVERDANVARLFSDFARRNFTKMHDNLEDLIPGDVSGPVGLVFKWPWLRGQVLTEGASAREPGSTHGLVLHNRSITVEIPGVRLLWISPEGKQLVLEPLSVLLRSIDFDETGSLQQIWSPEK